MKELLKKIKRLPYDKIKNLVLVDTCFLIDTIKHHEKIDALLEIKNLALTSFNIEELMHVEHKLDHEVRKGLRKFLKRGKFVIVEIPVHPGNSKSEKEFVRDIDNKLLLKIADPSDAVLIATAIVTKSKILTKDKHHLFTVQLENFLNKYKIKVFKNLQNLR